MTTENNKPLFRLMCAKVRTDGNGETKMGSAREIGAVWPIKDGKRWHQVSIDLMPIELTQDRALLYLAPTTNGEESAQKEGA